MTNDHDLRSNNLDPLGPRLRTTQWSGKGQDTDKLGGPPRATFEIYNADFRSVLERVGLFDCIMIDPPYPDYHVELYGYEDIKFLQEYNCRQLIFWSAKAALPLDYTARHVWDKRKGGAGSAYEFIYERNGSNEYWVFNCVSCNNIVRADMSRDKFTGHPSQKPLKLMRDLVQKFTNPGDTVIDMFMGSGSTGVACLELGRCFIGIEKQTKWFNIAKRRLENAQPALFTTKGGATQPELGTSEEEIPSNE